MPPHYEDAAHLLRMLTGSGITIKSGIEPRLVISRLAAHFGDLRAHQKSHTDLAIKVLQDLDKRELVSINTSRRARTLAVLATVFGNFLTMQKGAA